MPDLLHLSPEARAQALRDYIEGAADQRAAVAFMVEILDPVSDQALLALLEEIAPDDFTHAANK